REPAQGPLRRREEARFGSDLRFQPEYPRGHAPGASIGGLDLPVATQRDPRAHHQPQAPILALELGTERTSGGPRAPVLGPFVRSHGQITSVGPCMVAVAGAHAQPRTSLGAPLEQRERLAIDRKSVV